MVTATKKVIQNFLLLRWAMRFMVVVPGSPGPVEDADEALVFARAEAERRGRPFLGVCVLAGNKAGQAFYERQGARRIGERVAFRLGKEPVLDILYRFDPVTVSPSVSGSWWSDAIT